MNIYITDRSTKLNKKMIEVIDEKRYIYIYIEDITWPRGDTNFIVVC